MEKFTKEYEKLTESEKRVFSYIYRNQKKVATMKIQDLATEAFSSKAVIIKMCQKLGFEGFGDLKYYIKTKKSESLKEISYENMQNQIIGQVKKTLTISNMDTLRIVAQRMIHSKTIYIVGRGTSKTVTNYLEHILLVMGLKCINLEDYNLISTVTRTIDMNETIIIISLSGETEKSLEVARIAKARNASVIAMTGFFTNSLSKIADYTLFCAAETSNTKSDDTISRLGMFVVVDMLIAVIKEYCSKSVFKD